MNFSYACEKFLGGMDWKKNLLWTKFQRITAYRYCFDILYKHVDSFASFNNCQLTSG